MCHFMINNTDLKKREYQRAQRKKAAEIKQNESLEDKQQRLLKQGEYKRAQRKQGNKEQNKRRFAKEKDYSPNFLSQTTNFQFHS